MKLIEISKQHLSNDEIIRCMANVLEGIEPQYFKYKYRVSDIEKYNERVFTNELYHKFRSSKHFEGYQFFSELRKHYKNDFIPDILMHSPDNLLNILCLEAKINPEITAKEIVKDLEKLKFTIKERGYQLGIFLCANFNFINRFKKLEDNRTYNEAELASVIKFLKTSNLYLLNIEGPGKKVKQLEL